ncbi:MAG: type II toxin-antitoxin system VapC family toxin [Thaumarchaeota archaeon]|nr:type II toxin-antitoxin system VapC family toxin [Nitrososphaerota archaeon]
MVSETLFLDTSIPIYAAGKPSEHKDACIKILERIERGELKTAIDTEVIQEILYRFHRLNMQGHGIELSRQVLRLGVRVLPVLRRDIDEALLLFNKYFSRGVPPRDALHASVMVNNGINKIVTLDKHFGDVMTELQRVEPKRLVF